MENLNSTQKPYNFAPNIEAVLVYFIPVILPLISLAYEKENKFVRFHAFQSLLFTGAAITASVAAGLTYAIFIGALLLPLMQVGSFILWLILMWKAYNNEEWELPYLGKIAHEQVNK